MAATTVRYIYLIVNLDRPDLVIVELMMLVPKHLELNTMPGICHFFVAILRVLFGICDGVVGIWYVIVCLIISIQQKFHNLTESKPPTSALMI